MELKGYSTATDNNKDDKHGGIVEGVVLLEIGLRIASTILGVGKRMLVWQHGPTLELLETNCISHKKCLKRSKISILSTNIFKFLKNNEQLKTL